MGRLYIPETRCPNNCSRRVKVAGGLGGVGAGGAPLGGGGGGKTVAVDPGTGRDMLCFNSGFVEEPKNQNKSLEVQTIKYFSPQPWAFVSKQTCIGSFK